MNRRSTLKMIAAAGVMAGGTGDVAAESETSATMPTSPDIVTRDRDWLDRQMADHYGRNQWRRPPDVGYYHQPTDMPLRVIASRETALRLAWGASFLAGTEGPDNTANDCEDIALRLRQLVSTVPQGPHIGAVFDDEAGHAWNIVPYADGVFELEPSIGQVISKDRQSLVRDDYGPGHGVVLL